MGIVIAAPTLVGNQPEIIEDVTVPDFFANGAVIRDRGEYITSIYYIERLIGTSLQNHVICRIHYPRSYWLAGLARANRMMGNGIH